MLPFTCTRAVPYTMVLSPIRALLHPAIMTFRGGYFHVEPVEGIHTEVRSNSLVTCLIPLYSTVVG